MILDSKSFLLDFIHGPAGDVKPEDGRSGLVRFLMDTLGVDLNGLKDRAVEQFTMIVETTVVVLLVVALFLILAWMVCRMIRGARICCCPVSHPGDVISGLRIRSRRAGFERQVIILIFLSLLASLLRNPFFFKMFKV